MFIYRYAKKKQKSRHLCINLGILLVLYTLYGIHGSNHNNMA